jgi:hypothetical protein
VTDRVVFGGVSLFYVDLNRSKFVRHPYTALSFSIATQPTRRGLRRCHRRSKKALAGLRFKSGRVEQRSKRDYCPATVDTAAGTMLPQIGCSLRFNHAEASSMQYFRERSPFFLGFPFLICLGACGPTAECDSPETRNAVLKIVSDDHRNPLLNYAAKNSNRGNASSEAEKSAKLESTRPLYRLGETIVTRSKGMDKRTLACSGSISATVGNTKASKEVNFTVQQAPDGKISVSVEPFQF